jgi:hypothetical protein
MLSLWSAVNPGVWVSNGPAEGGTWTIPGNSTIGTTTSMLNDPRTSHLGVHKRFQNSSLSGSRRQITGFRHKLLRHQVLRTRTLNSITSRATRVLFNPPSGITLISSMAAAAAEDSSKVYLPNHPLQGVPKHSSQSRLPITCSIAEEVTRRHPRSRRMGLRALSMTGRPAFTSKNTSLA